MAALVSQRHETTPFEVVVGLDGDQPEACAAIAAAWRPMSARALRVIHLPRMGYIAIRRRLLETATGALVISLNDDVEPAPGLVQAHIEAHEHAQRERSVEVAIVAGDSPIPRFPGETLFERLVRETGIVFFPWTQDATALNDESHDWGYRHCYGLNFSAPAYALRDVGGFHDLQYTYGYDDIEIAHRLWRRFGSPVLRYAEARAPHWHRFAPRDLLRREYALGQAAHQYALVSPTFAHDLFGRDISTQDELDYARAHCVRERSDAARIEKTFIALNSAPAGAVSGEQAAQEVTLAALAQQWTTVKRFMWRWGLLDAAEGRLACDDSHGPDTVEHYCTGEKPASPPGAPLLAQTVQTLPAVHESVIPA